MVEREQKVLAQNEEKQRLRKEESLEKQAFTKKKLQESAQKRDAALSLQKELIQQKIE